jgi:hypothetical protein
MEQEMAWWMRVQVEVLSSSKAVRNQRVELLPDRALESAVLAGEDMADRTQGLGDHWEAAR